MSSDSVHQAESIESTDAVYPSNLGAALYELGDYAMCFQAICRATNKLANVEEGSSFILRLSTRLAKTSSHGIRAGTISKSDLLQDSACSVIERLSMLTDKPDAPTELVAAWKDWRLVEGEVERMLVGADDARTHLSALPIFKKAAYVYTRFTRLTVFV